MRAVAVVSILAALLLGPSEQAPDALTTEFRSRLDAYVELHRQVGAGIQPRLEVTDDYKQICDACDALAAGIRRARATAKIGDVFTPQVGAMLRDRVRAVATPEAIREWYREIYDEPEARQRPRVTVNSGFWADLYSSVTPLTLLQALPALPPELAYRLTGRDLVLVDVDAQLVVDVLPEALPTALRP